MRRLIDLTGQTFGMLTVLARADNSKHDRVMWQCKCACGEIRVVRGGHLRRGISKSCGCTRFKHGCARSGRQTPEYRAWSNMRNRCANPKHADYASYGGRGISVCDRWRDSFKDFLSDMGPRPDDHSLDRINNDGDYEPGNSKWSTVMEQNNNTRANRWLTVNGERLTATDWSRRLGGPETMVHNRLRVGWSEYDAVTVPVGERRTL